MVLVLSFQDPSSPRRCVPGSLVSWALGDPAQGRAGVGGRGAPPLPTPRGAGTPPPLLRVGSPRCSVNLSAQTHP